MNGDTRLTNLTVVIQPACIHSSAASAHLAMQHLSQLEQHVEVLLRAHAVTTGYYDGSTLQVVLGGLHMVVEHLHNESLRADVLTYLGINHLLAALAIVERFLHDARADGGHLRTVVGVHDGGHNVTTEGRTNLIEQILIYLIVLLVLVRTNLQLCAVGSQTAGQRRTYTGTEITADDGGTHQADLRLLLFEEVHQDIGVGSRRIGEQSLAVEDKQLVNAVGQNLIFHLALDASTGNDGVEFHSQFIGELATLGQQLLRYFLYQGTFYFAIYKYVVHISINQ